MAPQITNLVPMTEVEAINMMLSAIGEDSLPLSTDLSTVTQADYTLAINTLRNTTRDVLADGWRFNLEEGVELAPAATFSWTPSVGSAVLLNIFKVPTGTLAWKQTPCTQNSGLDLVERLSKFYTETAAKVLVLYDRYQNRDGPAAAQYPFIYLDTISACAFEQMPESARQYVALRAARKFSQESVGSDNLRAFAADDERIALRLLKKDQGLEEDYNLFDTAEAQALGGFRLREYGGYNTQVFPGHS